MATVHRTSLLGICSIVACLGLSTACYATVIADFGADYQTPTPAAGWQYVHNPANVAVGSEGSYTVNQYNASGNWYTTGGANLPASPPDSYSVVGLNFMHPGAGASQFDGLEHYTLAKYTLSTAGHTLVTDITATTSSPNGGTELWISVNTGAANLVPAADRYINGGSSYAGSPSIDLGILATGDRVYVGIGPRGNDGNDSTAIEFKIQQVPEPSSVVLFGLGAVGLIAVARRRRSA